jgi:hypothetical protein
LGQHGRQASTGIRLVIAASGYEKVASRIDGKSLGRNYGPEMDSHLEGRI